MHHVVLAESKDSANSMETFVNIQRTSGLKNDDILSDKKQLKEISLNFEKEIKDLQNQNRNLFLLFFVTISIAILAIWFYFKKREKQYLIEREELLQKIESLKKKLTAQSVATPQKNVKAFTLDKIKIEKAIKNKLGESSWMILNLIFDNPSISNKEIAEKVSLSIEGVSSSLRRMYQAFEITSSSNKKITLIMKATRLSIED